MTMNSHEHVDGDHAHNHHEHQPHDHKNHSGHINFHPGEKILTIRLHSGIAGDMFLCGLARMLRLSQEEAEKILNGILPELKGSVTFTDKFVSGIRGSHCKVSLPREHAHRNLSDILQIISRANISQKAKDLSATAFTFVASAESRVHDRPITEVHFHEVGALDSILDICFTCELFTLLNPHRLIVSPLPIADGVIHCAHGAIPSPAPAVMAMLEGIPVRPFAAEGETVTPTGIALLKTFEAEFGPWPAMTIENIDTVYGTYVYEGVPNGATFAYGESLQL